MQYILGICLAILPMWLEAQSILEAYIAEGLERNLTLRQLDIELDKSREALAQAKAMFYPNVHFDASYIRAFGGRRLDFPLGDLLNPVYGTLNQITQSNNFPTITNERIQFLPDNFHETKVTFGAPVFNSDLRHNTRIREHLIESAAARKAAYERELRFRITEAYLQYLSAVEAGRIWTGTRETLLELRRFNESLVRNGVGTPDLISAADFELSKVERESATLRSAQLTAAAYFNFLLNRDLQAPIEADTALLNPLPSPIPPSRAPVPRPELQALTQSINAAAEAQRLQTDRRRLPQAYIGGEAGFQGFGYTFEGEQAYILAKVGLTYPLYNAGLMRSREQEARLETIRLQTQYEETRRAFDLQTFQAARNLEAAQAEYAAAEKGLEAARRTFELINNKYRNGQALFVELSDARNRYVGAQIQVSLSRLQIAQCQAAWIYASGE